MSPRIGPLVLAIMSVIARLAGAAETAEILALVSFAVLTLVLQRSVSLRATPPVVRARAAMLPAAVDASPVAN